MALYSRQAYVEAEPLMRRSLELRRRVHGPEHVYTLTSLNNLANLLWDTGRRAEAEPLLREIMETSRRTLGPKQSNTSLAIYNYADILRELGRFEEAEVLFRETLALDLENLPAGHWHAGLHRSRYGELLLQLGRLDEAEAALLAGYHVLQPALGDDHDRTQRVVRVLMSLYDARGDAARSEEWKARSTKTESE